MNGASISIELSKLEKMVAKLEKIATPSVASSGYDRWQPISTVPKDGTWIMLGYYPEYMEGKQQGGHPVIAWWNDTKKLWCDGASFLNAEGAFSPTHWMPLPEGP